MEYHISLTYQKMTVQDFNFQLFGILRVSTLRFGGSPLLYFTSYSNLSDRGVRDFNQIDAIFSEFTQNLVRLSQFADRQKGLKICKVYSIYCCPKDGYPGKISTFKKVSRITFLRILF